MFNEQKTTEMVLYFLKKTNNNHQYYLMLMKLLYLSERESYARFGYSMTGDTFVSMNKGPVLSRTLELMQGGATEGGYWDHHIESINNYRLAVRSNEVIDFNTLSQNDRLILDEVWEKFGSFNRFELCDWTHENCQEWTDPKDSSIPITKETLLSTLGYHQDDIKAILEEEEAEEALLALL